jgi:hypothetical protein
MKKALAKHWPRFSLRTLFVVVTAFAIFGGCTSYFVTPPSVSANLTVLPNKTLELEVWKNFKVRYIMSATLYVDGGAQTPLWETHFENHPGHAIVLLETDEPLDIEQLERVIAPGKQFYVSVEYQYDSAIPPAACVSTTQFAYRLSRDGSLEYLGRR